MEYEDYQLENFLTDDNFVQWVKNPQRDLFWGQWLAEHPAHARTVAIAREIILATRYKNHYQPTPSELSEVWEKVGGTGHSGRPLRLRRPLAPLLRYAAIFLLAAVAGLSAWVHYSRKTSKFQPPAASAEEQMIIRKTASRGERLTVQLPDGSEVTLNSESTITYARDFGKGNRHVNLAGEAFFDVKKDSSHPFTIQTGVIKTTVVGTSFNINAYPESPEIKIAVLTGKVKVEDRSDSTSRQSDLLLPSEMFTYEKAEQKFIKEMVHIENAIAWKENILLLKNAGYEEIRDKLERWYAVTFIVEEGAEVREEFSARFQNAPLEEVLDALNYTSRFQYELKGDKVYVKRKK